MGLYERSLIDKEDQRDIVFKGPNRLEIQKDSHGLCQARLIAAAHGGSEVR